MDIKGRARAMGGGGGADGGGVRLSTSSVDTLVLKWLRGSCFLMVPLACLLRGSTVLHD